jgi:hypothetical protein
VDGMDCMEFESILVSKGLPHAEFSQKGVIDAHRSITSHDDVRHLTSGAIRYPTNGMAASEIEQDFVGFF